MFDNIIKFFKKFSKEDGHESKDTAKERLHLVLMQDRANVSADFMELMKQEIIEVIKKYIDVDENSIDVKLTNKVNNDGTTGVPMLYANIPIVSVKEDAKQIKIDRNVKDEKKDDGSIKEEKSDNKVEKADIEVIEESGKIDNTKKNSKVEQKNDKKIKNTDKIEVK